MNPNNNDPNDTPPVDGVNPAPAPEAPATPVAETPAQPAVAADPFAAPSTPETPVAPEAPTAPSAPEAPVAPVSPAVPAPASPFTAGTPAAAPEGPKPSKFSKKTLLIAAIVGGVVLLAIIATIIFIALTTVSKADYRDAVRQYNKVSVASAALTSDVTSLSSATSTSSDETFNERLAEVEDSIEKIKTENEALSKLKAVRVGEGAKLYNVFNDKVKAYLAYGTELTTSVKNLRPALVTCSNSNSASSAAAGIAAMKACASELSGVSDIPNPQMKAYITSLSENYTKYAAAAEKASALTNPYGSQYEEYKVLRAEMSDSLKKVSESAKTFRDDLDKRDDELSVKESSKQLGDFLNEQQKS